MLTALFQAAGESHELILAAPGSWHQFGHLRFAFSQCARLIHHHGVHFLHTLKCFGIADQHTALSTPPNADHNRHGRCQPQSTGASNNQHAHRSNQTECHRGRRPEQRPGYKGDNGDHDHRRHKIARDPVGQALNGRAAALGAGHHLHNLGQHGVPAHLVRTHDETALLVDAAADHLVS